MESFYSIQGEGTHTGKPSYFIRLAGCDVNCHWCDVKDSWDIDENQFKTVKEIVNDVLKSPAEIIVITGGEPLMHDLTELTTNLKEYDKKIHLETSGTHPLSGNFDWICFSPKKFKFPCEEAYQRADELKIIVFNKSDFRWAEKHAEKVSDKCILYLQAEWSKKELITPLIIDYVKTNIKWKISLQTHKYLDIP